MDRTSGDPIPAGAGAWTVRPARPDDVPRVWEMLLGLATYERMRDEVVGSPERLAEHLFGSPPLVECWVADSGTDLVGYALVYPNYSSFRTAPTLWLEDLYVEPAQRGRGAGRALLSAVARLALERGCAQVGWLVLDWNRPSIDFYESAGARRSEGGWLEYHLDREALGALAGPHAPPAERRSGSPPTSSRT
jgi:GNAT superfamily N-acetyltransferase